MKMKCLIGLLPLFAALSGMAQSTITFDGLPSSAGATIPNGYAGFQWSGFLYLDSRNQPGSGFGNGTVSPYNVAFDQGGNPANFSSSTPFTFGSAYLTGAWNNGLNVEVQGFAGGTLEYDRVYTVNATGPTLINFNYAGVTEVNFIPSGGSSAGYPGQGEQFVMDSLTIIVPEPGVTGLLCLGAAVLFVAKRKQMKRGLKAAE